MNFILTIDTEADNQWHEGSSLTVENLKFIPRFQSLCDKYNIKPTYLVTSEVCDDDFAKEILKEYVLQNKAEVGAHLHSWTTFPFLNIDGYRYNDKNHAFATELPEELLNEKIKNLTSQVEDSFGKRPSSFRSGRYGFSEKVARILHENAYLVDSSVTPFTSWTTHEGIFKGKGGPDFVDHKPFPYKYEFAHGSLLEIPITILPTKFPLNRDLLIVRYFFRNFAKNIGLKVARKIFFYNQPLWLRPYNWMRMEQFEEILTEARNLSLPFIVMIFHSSELMPGGSIYRANKTDVENLYIQLENFFILLHNQNIASITLTEAANSSILQ